MLALRLSLLLETIISPTQTGFVPHRSTSLNLRTLFTVLHRIDPDTPAAAILLDAEKAFDSLEWPFFLSVMRRMGMPNGFVSVVALLYQEPTARLRINVTLSRPFGLSRGTRQGCPLSPLLFILALDPLVRHFQERHMFRGLQFRTGPLLMSLYADDIILYVRQPQHNLTPLIEEITRFGIFSGLRINWNKSIIFPLTASTVPWESVWPLTWCTDSVKYLGIHFHLDTVQIIRLNYGPALDNLDNQITKWTRLPLSMMGRIALIKMIVLPRFLYLFNNIPIPLTEAFFQTLNSSLIRLTWGNKNPRIGWRYLTLPYARGGLGIPNFKLYYLVAQCSYSHVWYHPDHRIPYYRPEADFMLPDSLTSILPRGLPRDPSDIQTLYTAGWAWDKLRCMLRAPYLYSSSLPLPNSRWMPIMGETLVKRTLATYNLTRLGDLFPAGHVLSVTDDSRFHTATFMEKFTLNRIKSALREACPTFPLEPDQFPPLTTIIDTQEGTHMVSKLYRECSDILPVDDQKLRAAWEADLGQVISDEQWETCCEVTGTISLNNRHKLLHYKFLRRAYVTPSFAHKIDSTKSHCCGKCKAPHADFIHMTWTCPNLHTFWMKVHDTVGQMIQLTLNPLPEIALLGYTVNFPAKVRRFVALCFLLAKREIALHWGLRRAPTSNAWMQSLTYCNTQSEVYATTLPRSSRPKDIWGPLKQYLTNTQPTISPHHSQGVTPAGIG